MCQYVQMTLSKFVSMSQINGSLKAIPISGNFEQIYLLVDLWPEI